MKARKKRNGKKRSLFTPDVIATKIHQAISRDMNVVAQKFDDTHPIGRYAKDQSVKTLKKYTMDSLGTDDLEQKTFAKFHMVNEHMLGFTGENFTPPSIVRILRSTPKQEAILLKARAYMHSILSDFDEEEWFDQCRNGPGTTVGTRYADTSVEAKLTFPISMTARVAPLMDRYLAHNFQLRAAAEIFNAARPLTDKYTFVTGSRATTVEKTNDIRRMIALEPTGNMLFQQGLMSMMYDRMAKVGLDVEVLPTQHQERARISSITSSEATIDWSSASDCLSRDLLRWLMPPKWFMAADLCRSSTMSVDNTDVELNMFSTMGNAVTFPLETLVFFTIGHAVKDIEEGNRSTLVQLDRKDWLSISVFGDDCIVPTTISEAYITALESVGFLINRDKSFYRDEDDGFRESCGGDFLNGYDVRPVCIKAPTSMSKSALEPWLYTIVNLFTQKYISCFGKLSYIYEKQLFKTFTDICTEWRIAVKLVPSYFPDDAGLKLGFDLERLATCYPQLKFAEIKRDRHGTYNFSYCRFIYRHKEGKCDDIHYALALQKPVQRESSPWRSIKKRGGYVVSKGITCHWHVPQIRRV